MELHIFIWYSSVQHIKIAWCQHTRHHIPLNTIFSDKLPENFYVVCNEMELFILMFCAFEIVLIMNYAMNFHNVRRRMGES